MLAKEKFYDKRKEQLSKLSEIMLWIMWIKNGSLLILVNINEQWHMKYRKLYYVICKPKIHYSSSWNQCRKCVMNHLCSGRGVWKNKAMDHSAKRVAWSGRDSVKDGAECVCGDQHRWDWTVVVLWLVGKQEVEKLHGTLNPKVTVDFSMMEIQLFNLLDWQSSKIAFNYILRCSY